MRCYGRSFYGVWCPCCTPVSEERRDRCVEHDSGGEVAKDDKSFAAYSCWSDAAGTCSCTRFEARQDGAEAAG